MAWEKLKPHRRQRMPDNVVTIYKNGALCVTSIQKHLGDYVELFYDVETKRLALKPSQKTDDNFEVKRRSSHNSWSISLYRIIKLCDLQDATGKRYWVTQEDDMFVIDLSQSVYHLPAL